MRTATQVAAHHGIASPPEPKRHRLRGHWFNIGILLALLVSSTACVKEPTAAPEPAISGTSDQSPASDQGPASDKPAVTTGGDDGASSYLLFNQKWLEGMSGTPPDLDDVDAMFWHIFSRLPDEVTVYPSENYYYFIIYTGGRQIWGNIRLAAGRREHGVLSFAYFEFKESPFVAEDRIRKSKFFTDADGLIITEKDRFTFVVRYNGREVTFNLHQLKQEPPNLFQLGEDEVFVMRTFDESGYQFFLLFNKRSNYLFWVLNEEEPYPDRLEIKASDVVVGRRSGFAFFVDKAHDNRKVLAAIRGANATVNNYFDGPFDQLADNYVDVTHVSEYLQLASPTLKGRIDKYGYYTDGQRSSRVAVSPYYVYFSVNALDQFMEGVRASEDPYQTISRRSALRKAPSPTPGP